MVHVILLTTMSVLVLVLQLMVLHYSAKCANQQNTIDFFTILDKHRTGNKSNITDIAQEINNLSDEDFRKLDKQIIRRSYDNSKN